MNKGQRRSRAAFDVLGRIRQEEEKRGWSDYKLAESSGLTPSTISTWLNRGIEPGIASIEKVCAGFGISLSEFFQTDDEPYSLTDDQKQLLELWLRLLPEQRKAVIELLKTFSAKK